MSQKQNVFRAKREQNKASKQRKEEPIVEGEKTQPYTVGETRSQKVERHESARDMSEQAYGEIQDVMKKVISERSKITEMEITGQLASIENNRAALEAEGAKSLTTAGENIAESIKSTIGKLVDSNDEINRSQLKGYKEQLKTFDTLIENVDSNNDEEKAYIESLRDTLKDSITRKQTSDLALANVIKKEAKEKSIAKFESAVEGIGGTIADAFGESPIMRSLTSGLFSFLGGLYNKAKEARKELRETVMAHKMSALEALQKQALSNDLDRIESSNEILGEVQDLVKITKDDAKEGAASVSDLAKMNEEQREKFFKSHQVRSKTPEEILERPNTREEDDLEGLIDSLGRAADTWTQEEVPVDNTLERVADELSEMNRDSDIARMDDTEVEMENKQHQTDLIDSVNEVRDAVLSGSDGLKKKKGGLMSGLFDFAKEIPIIIGAWVGAKIKWIKGIFSKMFTPFKALGKMFKSGSILKILKLGKLAKGIPGIGIFVTAIEGIFSFFNAKDVLGKETVNLQDRIAAGIGGVFEGLAEIPDMINGWLGVETDFKGWVNENFTRPLAELFNMDLSEIWGNMKEFYGKMFNDIKIKVMDFGSGIVDSVKEVVSDASEWMKDIFNWDTVADSLKTAWKWSPMNMLIEFGKKAKEWLQDKLSFFKGETKDEDTEALLKRMDKAGTIDRGGIMDSPELTNIQYMRDNLSVEELKKLKGARDWSDNDLAKFDSMIKLNQQRAVVRSAEMEQLPTEKYIENFERPVVMERMNEEIQEDKEAKVVGNAIATTNNQTNDNSTNNSYSVTADPRDDDPHTKFLQLAFSP